jgi:hypothetical protein
MLPEAMAYGELAEDLEQGRVPLDAEVMCDGRWVPCIEHPELAPLFDSLALRLRAHREGRWARVRAGLAVALLGLVPSLVYLASSTPGDRLGRWSPGLRVWWWELAQDASLVDAFEPLVDAMTTEGLHWPFLIVAAWLLQRLGGWSVLWLVALMAALLDSGLAHGQQLLWLSPLATLTWTLFGAVVVLGLRGFRRLPMQPARRLRITLVVTLALFLMALIQLRLEDLWLGSPWHRGPATLACTLGVIPGAVLAWGLMHWRPRRWRAGRWVAPGALPDLLAAGALAALLTGSLWLRVERTASAPLELLPTRWVDLAGLEVELPTGSTWYWPGVGDAHPTIGAWLKVDLLWPQASFQAEGSLSEPIRRWDSRPVTVVRLREDRSLGGRPARVVDLIQDDNGEVQAHSLELLVQGEGHGWRLRCGVPAWHLEGRWERQCWDVLATARPGIPSQRALWSARMEAEQVDAVKSVANATLLAQLGDSRAAGELLMQLPGPLERAYWAGAVEARWQAVRLCVMGACKGHCWGDVQRAMALFALENTPLEERDLLEAAVQTLANGRKCAQARPFLEGRLAGQGLGGRCDSAHRRPSQAR